MRPGYAHKLRPPQKSTFIVQGKFMFNLLMLDLVNPKKDLAQNFTWDNARRSENKQHTQACTQGGQNYDESKGETSQFLTMEVPASLDINKFA